MTGRIAAKIVALIFGFLVATSLVGGAEDGGRVDGTLTDEQGRPIAGALVTITSSTAEQTTSTGKNGSFIFFGVLPGHYTMVASQIRGRSQCFLPDFQVKPGESWRVSLQAWKHCATALAPQHLSQLTASGYTSDVYIVP